MCGAARLTDEGERLEMKDRDRSGPPADATLPTAEARLVEQIRAGDAEAGQRFVREQYPAIYRYLVHLTGRPDLAEDLTQETFLQGWRRLETFQGRGSLRSWLYQIARREFLQLLKRQRAEPGWDGTVEVAAPDGAAWMDSVELREVIDRLPLEQREVVLLHYLEGYSSAEIARIVDAPAGTVRYRLARARERLTQALGEDDLTYLNEPAAPMSQWHWLPLDQMYALEARLARVGVQAFGAQAFERTGPKPEPERLNAERLNAPCPVSVEEPMERREFLRQAAAGAAGLMLPEPEKAVVDARLGQKLTCAFKGTALSELCDHLRAETGVHLAAGPSVADEKVTLFCKKLPLREVMRQLSRPFGYAWLRSGAPGGYQYELAQDLRSQLLEEELRTRDRREALLALDGEMQRYRPYLGLTPEEARARETGAAPDEKELLETLAGPGWGAVQMYFRLTPGDLAALRAGRELTFSSAPKPGDQSLPAEMRDVVLQNQQELRVVRNEDRWSLEPVDAAPEGMLPAAVPEAEAVVTLGISERDLGRLTVDGGSGLRIGGCHRHCGDRLATGMSPAAWGARGESANARLADTPAMRRRVMVSPVGSGGGPDQPTHQKVTSADVLEAVHRATGLPITADFYTRLVPLERVSVREAPLFEALNQLAAALRARWKQDGGWLQFRSVSFYDDRLKEVPNRLLHRWTAARDSEGVLPLEALLEIAQLSDAQLDADDMAEGARVCFGLEEWDLARHGEMRRHAPFLAQLTPAQRQEARSAAGLPFPKLSLAQQQQFLTLAPLPKGEEHSLAELVATACLRLEYSQPGWFRRTVPPAGRSYHPDDPSLACLVPSPVRERTPEAALLAARRLDPEATAAQIVPSGLAVRLQFALGRPPEWGSTALVCVTPHGSTAWGQGFERKVGAA